MKGYTPVKVTLGDKRMLKCPFPSIIDSRLGKCRAPVIFVDVAMLCMMRDVQFTLILDKRQKIATKIIIGGSLKFSA